jgi:hypothetical protein
MKTKDLVRVIKEIIKSEVQKQVSVQVTRLLQEATMHPRQPLAQTNKPKTPQPRPDFQVQLDEPLISETSNPLLAMMSGFETDEYGGNMHFSSATPNFTNVNDILSSTAHQMQNEQEHGEFGPTDTSKFVKDYSKVLQKSLEKSNGQY